jgi:hypothetical protein
VTLEINHERGWFKANAQHREVRNQQYEAFLETKKPTMKFEKGKK